jgi:hypothetical protein
MPLRCRENTTICPLRDQSGMEPRMSEGSPVTPAKVRPSSSESRAPSEVSTRVLSGEKVPKFAPKSAESPARVGTSYTRLIAGPG